MTETFTNKTAVSICILQRAGWIHTFSKPIIHCIGTLKHPFVVRMSEWVEFTIGSQQMSTQPFLIDIILTRRKLVFVYLCSLTHSHSKSIFQRSISSGHTWPWHQVRGQILKLILEVKLAKAFLVRSRYHRALPKNKGKVTFVKHMTHRQTFAGIDKWYKGGTHGQRHSFFLSP